MQITILGTSAMVPTKTRNHSGILISFDTEGIMFDCGEAIQRQLKLAGIKLTKVTRVLLSHWHGDHVLGLPGLMQSLDMEEYGKKLQIYGPKGTIKKMDLLNQVFSLEKEMDYKCHDISSPKNTIIDTEKFKINAIKLDHRTDCYGFSFIEKDRRRIKINEIKKLKIPHGPLLGKLQKGQTVKHKGKTVKPDDVTYIVKGKKITYIADTRMCKNAIKLAKDSDVLICESTYEARHKEKAEKYYHLTSTDAANIASNSNSKQLILTHISQRYKDTTDLLNQTKDIFPNTELGYDLMKIKL